MKYKLPELYNAKVIDSQVSITMKCLQVLIHGLDRGENLFCLQEFRIILKKRVQETTTCFSSVLEGYCNWRFTPTVSNSKGTRILENYGRKRICVK